MVHRVVEGGKAVLDGNTMTTLQLAHPLELRQTTQAYLVTYHITVLAWIKQVKSLKCFYDSIVRNGGLLKSASGIKL